MRIGGGVNFVGLKMPPLNEPLIEVETIAGEVLDLYNESHLRRTVVDGEGLGFEFVGTGARAIVLRFRAVHNLRVEQPSDWAPEESTQIEHLLIRPVGPWPRVVFKAGGLTFEFDCGELCLQLGKHDLGS